MDQNLVLFSVAKLDPRKAIHSDFKGKLTCIQPNCYFQANENIRDFQ